LAGLGALLYDFGRHTHSASRDLSQRRCQHVHASIANGSLSFDASIPSHAVKVIFDAIICDEKERSSRRGAYYSRADTIVNSAEAACGPKAGGGLEASLERVEGEK